MTYRVSTKADGGKNWWCGGETIPADHTNVRPASRLRMLALRAIGRTTKAMRSTTAICHPSIIPRLHPKPPKGNPKCPTSSPQSASTSTA